MREFPGNSSGEWSGVCFGKILGKGGTLWGMSGGNCLKWVSSSPR